MTLNLGQCGDCGGFLPPTDAALASCPHCGSNLAGTPDASTGRETRVGRSSRPWIDRMRDALMVGAGGAMLATTLMACYGGDYDDYCGASEGDYDGDCVAEYEDCDDSNPNVYPGAYDAPGDGIDMNCDGFDGNGPNDTDDPSCDDGVQNGDETGVDCGGPDCSPCEGDVDRACESACEERDRRIQEDAFCPYAGDDNSGCYEACASLKVRFSAETGDAIDTCIATDPLCYITLDGCVVSTRYPDPVAHPTTVRGEGLDDHEGAQVFAALEVVNGEGASEWVRAEPVTIASGTFEVMWEVDNLVSSSHNVALFIDADSDGACGADLDLGQTAFAAPVGDYDAPAFALTLSAAPEAASLAVCAAFEPSE